MVDNSSYLKYKSLKNKADISYKGYQMQSILATSMLHYAYDNQFHPQFTKGLIRKLIFSVYDLSLLKQLFSSCTVLASLTLSGEDHKRLLQAIIRDVKGAALYIEAYKEKRRFNLRNTITSFIQVFKKFGDLPFKDKLYFASVLTFNKNLIDELESYQGPMQVKAHIASFNGNMESVLVQFFKKRNIKTFGVQHGVHPSYLDYKYYIPADVINIENFIADHFLSWGDFTREALIKQGLDGDAYLLAGNPKYSDLAAIRVNNTHFRKCLVCLARDIYFEENTGLLKIAAQLQAAGKEVLIKFHPRSDLARYSPRMNELKLKAVDQAMSLLDSVTEIAPDFVIVYNSTVYYEYYMNNILALRYGVNGNDVPFGLDDEFMDFERLMAKIGELGAMDNDVLNLQINGMIDRFCKPGVNNYKQILDNVQSS